MSELQSLKDYQSTAASIALPSAGFVDGGFQSGDGKAMKILNPATGKLLTKINMTSAKMVDYAVVKAREAFEAGAWSRCHPVERKDTLIRFCKLLTRNRHELTVMESIDSGKPILDCVTIDLPETIDCIKWHAESIDKIYDDVAPTGDDSLGLVIRQPIGVVGCVLPWNFPLMMMAWKIGPALAAGNSVIVKPSEDTTLTALRVAELAMEAGIPRGVLQVLPGDGPTTGRAIGLHRDIDMVSFTGSTETGRMFLRYSAESNLKEITLECGGKNPCVVLKDAEHIDMAAEYIANGAFWNLGQNCSGISRVIVDKTRHDELVEAVMYQATQFRQGDPLDPGNRLGVLVNDGHYKKVKSYIDKAKKDRLKSLCGKIDDKSRRITPTIFSGLKAQHKINREEVFGPVMGIMVAADTEQAVQMANDTNYGLAASVYSASIGHALRSARAINAGVVGINCYSEGDMTTPFGGWKESGFGGRDKGIKAHDQYTELKTIWFNLSDNRGEGMVRD